MSAVMSTLSMISGGRRSHQKLSKKSSRKSGQYSDFGEDYEQRKDLKEQRSASLQTLESPSAGGPPRVAHLESLEARMANIEVSLSTTRQHRRSGGSGAGSACGAATPAPVAPSAGPARLREQPARELDALRTALRDKDSLIQNLKEQLCTTISINRISASLSRAASPGGAAVVPGGSSGVTAGGLSLEERRVLEERAASTRKDADDKMNAIADLKQALERLHVTDNIDTRIQQAELEYQLGREELEMLTLMEQSRALQLLMEQADAASANRDRQTIYSCVSELPGSSVQAVEVDYDAKSPRFGASPRRSAPGLWVDWARDGCGLSAGDRLLEVNGALVVSCKSAEELWRALGITPRGARVVLLRPATAAAPAQAEHLPSPQQPQVTTLRAEIGALRERAGEAQRAKDGLRADNQRLTHRISYLEEQVAELLARDQPHAEVNPDRGKEKNCLTTVNKTKKNVTNINITTEPPLNPSPAKPEVQVFQKGPDITAIVANLPGLEAGAKNTAETSANLPIVRPKSNMSNVTNTHIVISSPNGSRARSVTSVDQSENEQCHYGRPPAHRTYRQSLDSYAMQLSKSSHSLDHKCKEKLDYAAERRAHKMRQSLSQHCISSKDKTLDYQAETAAALEIIKNNQKLYLDSPLRKELKNEKCRSDDQFRTGYDWNNRNTHSNLDYYNSSRNLSKLDDAKSTDNIVKKTNWAEKKTLSIIEQLKQSQRLRKSKSKNKSVENIDFDPERDYVYHRIDGKILENTHKSNRRQHTRNVKSLDVESENSDFPNGDYNSQKLIDYNSEPGSVKLGFYKKNSHSSVNGDAKVRPMPPKKPLRLSLHRANSSQSVCTDTCSNAPSSSEHHRHSGKTNEHNENYSHGDYSDYGHLGKSEDPRKPAKRNHKGDRFVGEHPTRTSIHKDRTNGTRNVCATPKPTKKLLNGFTSYDTPAADDVYPNSSSGIKRDVYEQMDGNGPPGYSPRTPSRSESVGSRTPSRADSGREHSEAVKWPPCTPTKTRNDHYRFNGHPSSGGKWC